LRKPSRRSGIHELRAGEVLVGRLDVKTWTGGSVAETAGASWRFDRPRGLSQRTVRVLSADGAGELTTFVRDGWGRRGAMEIDGVAYELRAAGWWKPTWTWTSGGVALASLTTRHTFRDERGRVSVAEPGRDAQHIDLLALLGVHLALLSAREAAAST
jgi:hypothetical protein